MKLWIKIGLLFGLVGLVACSEDKKKAEELASNTALLACTHYVDNTTHAYFECRDYSDSGMSSTEVDTICDSLNSGELSEGCTISYTGALDSSGECSAVISSSQMYYRWYYSTIGDGPSQTALCTTLGGTYTLD